jgi:hypothetical protein
MENNIQWMLAEVVNPDDENTTYKDTNLDSLFVVNVQPYGEISPGTIPCKPASTNMQQIPVAGEFIVAFKGFNQYSNTDFVDTQWYYLPWPLGLSGGINSNKTALIAQAKTGDVNKPGDIESEFEQKIINPLQPLLGDTSIQSRWGSSIRFGSTVDSEGDKYSVSPAWDGDTVGDPITIISNSQKKAEASVSGSFVMETPKDDGSSIYLTSTQKLKELGLGAQISIGIGETEFNRPQIVASSERIILTTKIDSVYIDSEKDVIINSTNRITLGKEDASSGIAKGDKVISCIQSILNGLNMGGINPAGPVTLLGTADFSAARSKLQEIESGIAYVS